MQERKKAPKACIPPPFPSHPTSTPTERAWNASAQTRGGQNQRTQGNCPVTVFSAVVSNQAMQKNHLGLQTDGGILISSSLSDTHTDCPAQTDLSHGIWKPFI